jgi:NAD(P)-dependent dehydrogenase (short-subunit alcohol dehydrogenase family)
MERALIAHGGREANMTDELKGQVAIVTGAGRGFGRAIATRLAAEGAAVTVTARTRAQVEETAAQIAAAGGQVHAVVADVTDREQVEQVVIETRERFGGLSLLVSNAGVADPFGPVWTVDPDRWWEAQAVHIRAPLLFLRAVLGGMVEAKRGRVIIVSAAAAHRTAPGLSAYCVGKTAQARLTQLVAAETKDHGVSLFAIDPGFVFTEMARQTMTSPDAQRWLPGMVQRLKEIETRADGDRDLGRCAQRCVDLASGRYDALSGHYMELDDDLDAWLAGRPPAPRTWIQPK